MDENKFAADFIAANYEKIIDIAKSAYSTLDEKIKIDLKKGYSNYLLNSRLKHSKSKSFFIRDKPVDLYSYYEPTGISNEFTQIDSPSFKGCLLASNRIIITGTGGSGKTILMKHLFLDCFNECTYVPVLLELRELNNNVDSLNDLIKSTLSSFGFDSSDEYLNKSMKEGHFAFFLDGFDEIDNKSQKKVIKEIKLLARKNTKCSMFISSRPDNTLNDLDDFTIFSVEPLKLEGAKRLITKLPFDESIKDKFLNSLSNGLFESHESFLSNPLLLSIMLLTYSETAEIPNKLSIFYNQAFEALFHRHDAYKGAYKRDRFTSLDIQEFSRIFALFSLQTYEKKLFKMPRTKCLEFIENSIYKSKYNQTLDFSSEDYLGDLISSTCLLIEDGLDIVFSHRSFQEYFVALYISSAAPDIQKQLIERYWSRMNFDRVIDLLHEINPELVERVLLLPKLDQLFEEIGVRKKVGISHGTKYLKKVYKAINIQEDKITATVNTEGKFQDYDNLVVFLVKNYGSFKFKSQDLFEDYSRKMHSKYGENKSECKYKIKDLTYRTPLMADTLNGFGAFSLEFLQDAYSSFLKLKSKHKTQLDSLNNLLGI